MGQDSKKDNGTQNKPAMEKVELAKLAPLPTGATDAEREAYIKAHHDSSVRSKERHLEGTWYIGKELPRLKRSKRLEGKRWDDFCQMRFSFGARQAQDYIKIAENFPTKADLKRLLKKADSIRQAVEAVKEEREMKQATSNPGENGGTNRRQPKQNRRGGSAAPDTLVPLGDAVRAELRDTGDDLWQLAKIDETAFGKLRKLIKKQLRIVQGKAAKRNAEDKGKAA